MVGSAGFIGGPAIGEGRCASAPPGRGGYRSFPNDADRLVSKHVRGGRCIDHDGPGGRLRQGEGLAAVATEALHRVLWSAPVKFSGWYVECQEEVGLRQGCRNHPAPESGAGSEVVVGRGSGLDRVAVEYNQTAACAVPAELCSSAE